MGSKTDWPFPASTITLRWRLSQGALIGLVHCISRLYLRCFQQVQTKNLKTLREAILRRSPGTPLVTVSNHSSCIDDPVLWSLIPIRGLLKESALRWVPAAKEVCFVNDFLSYLCARVRLVPTVRGDGVYQRAISYCVERLNKYDWVHIFPEGLVNVNGENMRMKWGVGQLIAESKVTPLVIPFYHVGMDSILPNRSPYIPKFFRKLTVLVGEPLDFTSVLETQNPKGNAVVLRRQITDIIQEKLYDLKTQAETLHREWNPRLSVWYRTVQETK